jgi:hypothetical protein
MQILHQGDKQRPIQTFKLGRIPLWQASRPSPQPIGARRWRAGPARVRPHPRRRLLGPRFSSGCMPPCRGGPWWFPDLPTPKLTMYHYIRRARSHSQHTHSFGASTSLPHLVSLALVLVCEQGQSYQGELVALKEENLLGMNTIKSSSKFLLSYHSYSSAYELDYSFCVIIMIYELAYSLDILILTCRTLCLIIHITYMSRIRAKFRWRFIVPLGVPMSYACRSIGSES